ncbi:MAG: MBL fold metallo-hydrolase [Flavobacteriaceae bacterium]|nr:MBL fold metallo-hydrolase [Flavobacteriaceae bacterium]
MKLYSIETGNFKLDGGAMFGVIPKTLWEKTNPPDKNNRIEMAARSLLIEDGEKLILIDTGLGNKQNEQFFSYFSRWGNHSIESSLKRAGFSKDDITDVFLTHLHFDHCGGAVEKNSGSILSPAFKNAHYWSNKDHWDWAITPNTREKPSFLKENFIPIKESGQLKLLRSSVSNIITSSSLCFEILQVDGHTEKQMLPLIKYKGKTILFAGDLFPTVGHLPVSYLMGYDVRPLITMKEKSTFLDKAIENDYLLFMEHDPYNELISLKNTEKGVRLNESFLLKDYF